MNQFADFENLKSKIENRGLKITHHKSPITNQPMVRTQKQ